MHILMGSLFLLGFLVSLAVMRMTWLDKRDRILDALAGIPEKQHRYVRVQIIKAQPYRAATMQTASIHPLRPAALHVYNDGDMLPLAA
jgi:hypothetical protein